MGKHRLHPAVLWDLRGTGLYTTLHPRKYEYTASTYRTRENVCSVMTCTATTELWQWARKRIAAVLHTDYRLCAPQWLVLLNVAIWSSVILHDYMALLRPACEKAEEIQKKDHIFGHYLAECIGICNLLHTLFLWLLGMEKPALQYALYTVNMKRCQPLSVQFNAAYYYWVDCSLSVSVRRSTKCFKLRLLI
jgi:hypothetical protein